MHIFRSNGTAVTLQLLQVGSVFDTSILDLGFQESLSILTFTITGFGDGTPEQRVLYYEAAVGSNPDYTFTRSDIVPFTDIGLQTTYTFSNLNLVSQQSYYITIRAHSVSGSIAQATSTGIIPGYGRDITPGVIIQPVYQSNTTVLSAHWSGFVSDVPLLYYEWGISNHPLNSTQLLALCDDINNDHNSDLIRGFVNVQLSTYASVSRLNLLHGQSYYVVIRALDQGGKCKTVISSSPTVIDTTPPIGNNSIIGPEESYTGREDQYIAYVLKSNQQLTLNWDDFTDMESPVEYYQVGLFELLSCTSFTIGSPLVNYVPTGLNTWYTFDNLQLVNNVTYVAKILATNRAGLTGSILSQPVMLDAYKLTPGAVKDGISWSSDAIFQSDLTSLSGVFSLAYLQPYSNGIFLNTPCPPSHTYTLTTPDSDWSNVPPSTIDGLSSIRYESGQVLVNDTRGTSIVVRLDPTQQEVVSGIYSTSVVSSLEETSVSLTIQSSIEDNELRPYLITSVTFIDDGINAPTLLADYDSLSQPFTTSFIAIGMQLHNSYNDTNGYHQEKIVLWSRDSEGPVQSVTNNVSIDLSSAHHYSFRFTTEQLGLITRRKVNVYIDNTLYLSLFDIPLMTDTSRMILNVFNRHGNIPPCPAATCGPNPYQVSSLFTNVSLHVSTGSVCDYGIPFYSWGSPIISLEAAIGTQPGYTDVKEYEVSIKYCYQLTA